MEEVYHGHPMFYAILDELRELHDKKNAQYATTDNPLANFNRCSKLAKKLLNPKIKNKPLAYLLILMSKQVDAVYEMLGECKTDTPEELEEKLKDIAVYSIIGIILERIHTECASL